MWLLASDRMAGIQTSSNVPEMSWQLDIEVPHHDLGIGTLYASIDAFTVRSDQGIRLDEAGLQLSGLGQRLSYSGAIRIPEWPGGFQDGDQGRLQGWIVTPSGSFGTGTVGFSVRPQPTGLASDAPYSAASHECQAQ